jgi:GNAT superfamily N-acetyltransferase
LTFRTLLSDVDPGFDQILPIYREAFPREQRMSPTRIGRLLTRRTMHLMVISAGGQVMGFAAWLHVPGQSFAWLEYLAVRHGRRGGGIGSALLTRAMRGATRDVAGVLIEVEPPDGTADRHERTIRRRRIAFYEKHHCRLVNGIRQPAMGEQPPMQLLLYPGDGQPSVRSATPPQLVTLIRQALVERRAYYEEIGE